ncbi:MAG: methyltransferase domain-containing protein [Candidatus Heimdallarchaeaceae archaeon]
MIKCICGCDKYSKSNHNYYDVAKSGSIEKSTKLMEIAKCSDCGILRRFDFPFSSGVEYSDFYSNNYPPCFNEYKVKDYDHDRSLSSSRCDSYEIYNGYSGKILDVGCGSGAFVDECRSRGADAFGCEIVKYSNSKNSSENFIYNDLLENINFPTDYFDIVTCHDVLEHNPDPIIFLKEIFRILKINGSLYIDFPNYYNESGKHHWKLEHLWYFNSEQLVELVKKIGFAVDFVKNPIESKILIKCHKSKVNRISILVPPGIGDSYWSLVKTKSFLKQINADIPDILIVCPREKKFNGHKRAFPFIEMFPFVHSSWETVGNNDDPNLKKVWKEAYARAGQTIFNNVLGCDYFISYNGHLRFGEKLDDVDPHLKCEWFPNLFISKEQDNYKKLCLNKYNKYIVFYFIFQGTYKYWTSEFSVNRVANLVNNICKQSNCVPILVGAVWDGLDKDINFLISNIDNNINLIGKTTITQLFGLIRGAEAVVGYPSGLTIMSSVLGAKTLIIWNDYYDRNFAKNSCPPECFERNYFIENTKGMEVKKTTKLVCEIIEGKKPKMRAELNKPVSRHKSQSIAGKRKPKTKKNGNSIREEMNIIGQMAVIDETNEQNIVSNLNKENELIIVCVLKSGGKDFDKQYVLKMKNMISRNVKTKHKFVTLSDINISGIETVKLIKGYKGWWSKLELFRMNGPVLYFDLDTVILDNIDSLANHVKNLKYGSFEMLVPFNPLRKRRGKWASGIMAWHGDFSYIFREYSPYNCRHKGDQDFIYDVLRQKKININPINNSATVFSQKRHCREGVPVEAQIICFHGPQKPHKSDEKWVKEAWK